MTEAQFWKRDDSGARRVATLQWDGRRQSWSGPEASLIRNLLQRPSPILGNRVFEPARDWDKLERLFCGHRLWAVVSGDQDGN